MAYISPMQVDAYQLGRLDALLELGTAKLARALGVKTSTSAVERFKLGFDIGGSIPIPGMGGLGISVKDQRERLPGMTRWVPRAALERGFDYADQGLDADIVSDLEADRGSLLSPGIGAALAAGAAHRFAPKSGVSGKLLAGLLGAGLGSAYHAGTENARRREGVEAFDAAERELNKFPLRRHALQTANESTPWTLARGSNE